MRVPLLVNELKPPNCLPSYQFFLPVLLICKYPMFEKQVTFLVDTGATYTALQDRDVRRLKIQYRDLERKPEKEWAKGVAGEGIETFLIHDVRMLLLSAQQTSVIWEANLPTLEVLRHPQENWDAIKDLPSLLGMDVLANFRLAIDMSVPEAFIETLSL